MKSALATGAPFVLLGLLLGPGLGMLDPATLRVLTPVTALGIGWIGARLGARLEWRRLRRFPVPRVTAAALRAATGFALTALVAWLLVRRVSGLAAAWQPTRPALFTLAAAAIAVTSRRGTSGLLDAAFGAAAFAVTLALSGGLRWLPAAAAVSGGVGLLFLWLSPLAPGSPIVSLGVLLIGAGTGYATGLSPFVVCALAAALIVNHSPRLGRRLHAALRAWERPVYAIFLVILGALLGLPTLWLLPAGLALGALRLAARRLPPAEPAAVPQGAVALALGVSFELTFSTGGGVLTTIVLGVALVQGALAFHRAPTEVT